MLRDRFLSTSIVVPVVYYAFHHPITRLMLVIFIGLTAIREYFQVVCNYRQAAVSSSSSSSSRSTPTPCSSDKHYILQPKLAFSSKIASFLHSPSGLPQLEWFAHHVAVIFLLTLASELGGISFVIGSFFTLMLITALHIFRDPLTPPPSSSSPPPIHVAYSSLIQSLTPYIWIIFPLCSAALFHNHVGIKPLTDISTASSPSSFVHTTTGPSLLLVTIITTAAGENAGLLFGKVIPSGHPFPRISPNKTLSGFIAQILLSGIVFIASLYYFIGPHVLLSNPCHGPVLSSSISFTPSDMWSVAHLFTLGCLMGFLGALGDLFESLFKRSHNVSVTGSLFPGWGGILDRMDGLLFTFPFSYFIYIYQLTWLTTCPS